jgi:hypothetical protein
VGLLDVLDIQRAAHIFGISLGGMVSDRVDCLFSVMSSSGNPDLPQAAPEIRARMLTRHKA